MIIVIQNGDHPVRPERFAWSDEEARLIFGADSEDADIVLMPSRSEPEALARILLAGRYDPAIQSVRSALEAARDALGDRFVILEWSGQYYMQCLCGEAGWVLEKREGHDGAHFRGWVNPPQPEVASGQEALMARLFPAPQEAICYLSFEQVLEAMDNYRHGRAEPRWLQWKRVDVS